MLLYRCLLALALTLCAAVGRSSHLTGDGTGYNRLPRLAPTPVEQAVSHQVLSLDGTDSACTRPAGSGVCWDLAACAIADVGLAPPYSCSPGSHGLCGADAGDDFKRRPGCYVWGEEVLPPTNGTRTGWDLLWNDGGMSSFSAQVSQRAVGSCTDDLVVAVIGCAAR